MNRLGSVLFAMTLLACGGGDNPSGDDDADPDAGPDAAVERNTPGTYTHVETFEEIDREFIVYVPESARGDTHAPVVFMLHGTSGDGQTFYDISGWTDQADEHGLIAVFPSSLTYCYYEDKDRSGTFEPGERFVFSRWASGALGDSEPLCTADDLAELTPQNRALVDHPLKDDVAFFDEMIDFLDAHYSIDLARIYVSGFSNGSEMSQRLAIERSTRFAAAAGHAGTMRIDPTPTERPISIVLSVGALDDRFEGELGPLPIPLTEDLAADPEFDILADRMLQTYQLADTYTHSVVTIADRATSQFLYATSTVGASNSLRIVIVQGNAHHYPNGNNHPIVMANVLWEFFQQHALP